MREILFRGKSFYDGKWVKGFIAASRENMYPNGFEMITVDGINYNELDGCIPHFTSYAVDPSTIGQYTGLKDKNGKKIFEGDIIRVEHDLWQHDLWHGENKKTRESDIGIVIYNTNTAEFGAKIHGYCNCLTLKRWKGDFNEVIGNIHDKKLEDFENG